MSTRPDIIANTQEEIQLVGRLQAKVLPVFVNFQKTLEMLPNGTHYVDSSTASSQPYGKVFEPGDIEVGIIEGENGPQAFMSKAYNGRLIPPHVEIGEFNEVTGAAIRQEPRIIDTHPCVYDVISTVLGKEGPLTIILSRVAFDQETHSRTNTTILEQMPLSREASIKDIYDAILGENGLITRLAHVRRRITEAA